ncbi:hypothetical protein ACFSQD_12925 [Flavihumibacter stibioxidans]|uniref:Uncharacterized protein n=1 Tax=Flavihumibacter stibioxidans TaxID=1834163 RepID=A0ABR7M906_9BACT|nr:hypothetical protein [Flavihumibacter stibioxidans]MBC6491505.1 hypothetical protein [Flavihumibacter stibioxidans]
MRKHLLSSILIAALLSDCASGPRNHTTKGTDPDYIVHHVVPADSIPVSMMDQPRTEDGAFVLSPGFYEADFKTYCLQPGTPDPSRNDAYFQAPLTGPRKEIIETILRNSQKESQLDQRNIQLLLWAVVSRTSFNKLAPEVQSAGWQLLSSKQVFELNGGVVGMAKTVANMLPSGGGFNDFQKLFDLGIHSYEAYEKLAVLKVPSEIRRPGFKLNQWYQHEEGYYVRYYPDSYKKTKIQVYVPGSKVPTDSAVFVDSTVSADSAVLADSTGLAVRTGNYIVFDPASMVIAPANTNAQRLGIGAPVVDIVRSVIKIIDRDKRKPSQPQPPKQTKGGVPVTSS